MSAGQRSICLLSPAIAQRTGVNKSVSFARWQQGRGLLCLAPQLVETASKLSVVVAHPVSHVQPCMIRNVNHTVTHTHVY